MEKSSKLKFSEVVVVEASAGAGKTYALAKRYLNLLINPALKPEEIPIKSILAITFTNKATVEMKERILEFLKRLAFDEFGDDDKRRDDLHKTFGISKAAIQQKASNIMDLIIRDYDLFQVQTIDSFINALLTGCALHIDRTAGFRIKDTPNDNLTYALDLLIEESVHNEAIRKVFINFLDQYMSSSKNASWFPKDEMFNELVSLYTATNTYGLPFRQRPGDYGVVVKLKKEIFNQLNKLAVHTPEGQNSFATKRIQKILGRQNEFFELEELPWFYKNAEPPMNKGKVAPADYIKKWQKLVPLSRKLAELETQTKYPVYVTLFNLMLGQFAQIARQEDVLFLNELNSKAAEIIGGDKITIPEIFYRMATRFRHYLLDEFQDTSELQWQNLYPMIDDALASGGSLFYVGDCKQAIFRFRGGEPQLFTQVAKDFDKYNVQTELLTKNRRSEKAIVEFNNQVFSKDNLTAFITHFCAEKEMADSELFLPQILNIYQTAQQEHLKEKKQGYVRVEYIKGNDKDEQEQAVRARLLATITQLHQRFAYGDMAILTRDNKRVELITNWLLDEKISAESERTLNVLNNRMVLGIISLLKFLQSPVDELHFGGFILGEVFSKATGITQSAVRDYLFELKSQGSGQGNLYAQFRGRYPQIWEEYLEWFFKSAGFISPYELIVTIYQRFRVMPNFPENQAFFVKFLDFVKAAEDEYIDLDGLLKYLADQAEKREADIYVRPPQSNAIKVQTIHKSKGLEFPVVIIPFLELDVKRDNPFISKSDDGMDLLYITKEHTLYSERVKKIYYNDYLNNLIDELNSIYVALTRAKLELYVFIPAKEKKDGGYDSLACALIPTDKDGLTERGVQVIYPAPPPKEHSQIMPVPLSEYQDWLKSLKEDIGEVHPVRSERPVRVPGGQSLSDKTIRVSRRLLVDASNGVKNRARIIEGNVMHFLLSRVPNCQGQDIAQIIKQAIQDAQYIFPSIKDFTAYENRLKQILKAPDLAPFFYVTDGTVYCEKEFVNKYGDSRRIDRLIVTDKEVFIIDYKSSTEPANVFQKQIREYMEIVGTIYPARTVKAYVVFLDSLIVETMTYHEGTKTQRIS